METGGEDFGFTIPHETLLSLRSCDASVARQRLEDGIGAEGVYDQIRARRKEIMKPYLMQHDPELKEGVDLVDEHIWKKIRSQNSS